MLAWRNIVVCVLVVCVLCDGRDPGVAAAADPVRAPVTGLSIRPSSQVVDNREGAAGNPIAPGDRVRRYIEVTNNSSTAIVAYTDLADVVATTDGTSLADIVYDVDAEAHRWLSGLPKRLKLPPRATRKVPVDVRVPDDASSGSHAFAVAFTQRFDEGGPAVRLVSALIVTVGGADTAGGRIEDVRLRAAGRGDAQRFYLRRPRLAAGFTYRNDSELFLVLEGSASIGGLNGGAGTEPVRIAVYPHGTVTWNTESLPLPTWGIVRPRVTLDSAAGRQVATFPTILIIPAWFVILATGVLGAALTFAGWRIRRFRRFRRARRASDADAPGT